MTLREISTYGEECIARKFHHAAPFAILHGVEFTLMDFLAAIDVAYSTAYGVVNAALLRLQYPLMVCAAYGLLEWLLPRRKANSWRSYLRAARFVAASVLINTIVLALAEHLVQSLHLRPLAIVDLRGLTESPWLPQRVAGWIAAAFAISLIGNVFYYWLHRAQHRVQVLWRQHSVHHSIREMSAASSYHHFTEDILQFVFVVVPMSILLGVESGPVPWIVLAITATHSYFIHSSTRLHLGWLRYVIGDNRFHRLHHSLEPKHFNKNFGTSTPLWDVLFGTAYFPSKDEWPEVGLEGVSEPETVKEYLVRPFVSVGREQTMGARLDVVSRRR